jgi:hypothetical protein
MTDQQYMVLFGAKLVIEFMGCWSDNWYMTGSAVRSAVAVGLTVAGGIYIGRVTIADRDNVASAIVIAAVMIARYYGCLNLAETKYNGPPNEKGLL